MHPSAFRKGQWLTKMYVVCARWVGMGISVIKRGAAPDATVSPKSIKQLQQELSQSKCFSRRASRAYRDRAPMNIPTEWEAAWRMVATIMMDEPMTIAGRRPSPSER